MRSNVFHTRCTSKDRVCLVIIDSGSFENCVSFEMVQKLGLKMDPHPKPYKLSCLQEGSDIKVKHRCLVSFTIGKHYQDEVWCDVVPMDVCHLLLGRPWQYDRQIIYDGFKSTYAFRKDGHKIVLAPLKPTIAPASKPAKQNSLLSKSEMEKEIRVGSDVMALVAIEETESEKEIPKRSIANSGKICFCFFFFFLWINKNLFPKGKNPTKNTHEVKKDPKKPKKRTAPPLKQRKRGISQIQKYT